MSPNIPKTFDFGGEVALVTGSGRGLGRMIAETLLANGASVALHDINEEAPAAFGESPSLSALAQELSRRGGAKVIAVTGDITRQDEIAAMVKTIEAGLGPISILVNCAGGDIGAAGGKPDPNDALGIPLEDIRALTENNLYGTILVCQAFVPPMVKAGSGSVINIGSAAAQFGVTNGVIYAALKAAVIHYTRCLAASVRTEGVRINAVSPGATKTARFEATRIVDPKKMDSSIKSLIRYGEPEEMADAVAFLAGPRSKYISGQVLRVDGGETLFPG